MIKRRRAAIASIVLIAAILAAWLYWNRRVQTDMSAWVPADSLAFAEANDLTEVITGIENTEAWKSLAAPMGAPPNLSPNRWWIRLARWTGIGSAEAILLARSQAVVVLSGAEGAQDGSTFTIKPLTTLVIETHTSQRRMRAVVERHLEDLARRVYQNPSLVRKQVGGTDLEEWTSTDGSHRIVFVFVDTAVVVGNDEPSVLHAIEAHRGSRASLLGSKELNDARNNVDAANAAVFGFVSQAGVKSLLQAFALYRGGSSPDAVTAARIFADIFGGVVKNVGWTSRFRDGMVEDRCSVTLADGVADKLRNSMVPERGVDLSNLSFVPTDVHSFSLYRFHDTTSFWTDVNAAVSSHTDLVGAIAARPTLRGMLKPYGIDDPDTFARAIGTRIQTIRFEAAAPSVLIAEAYDRPALRKTIAQRFGANPKTEKLDDVELLLSPTDNWAATFVDNYFLIGPAEFVRRCLQARAQSQSVSLAEGFRKSQQLIDVTLPVTTLTLTNDQGAAISFVEAFTHQDRSAFSTNAGAIVQTIRTLPYAVSVSLLKGSAIEWTSRSSFGIGGSLVVQLFPEISR